MTPNEDASSAPVRILIAEDSPTQAARLKYILQHHGYEVSSATNGKDALEMIERQAPTLVISDIVMPEMDGYELCRRIKSSPASRNVPVILLTTLADLQDVVRGLECGADNFIVKPYDDKYLISRIQFVLLNRAVRCDTRFNIGVEIHLNGQLHVITADRLQILNLLLSTYEAAIQRNQELTRIKDELRTANSALETTIKELAQTNDRLKVEVAEREEAQQALRVLNQQLTEATNAAEAANTAKSAFLANMSHEIRTPMTAIIGYADLILGPDKSQEDRANYVRIIRRNGEHLLTLINDILDLSKIEAGKFVVTPVECSPVQILNEVKALMQGRADEMHLKLDVTQEGVIPAAVLTDPLRLRQILVNLLGNAIKFTRHGGVRVKMMLEESNASARLRFDITDSGIGMTAAVLENLFQPFVQADNSTTRQFGGTGLGLMISKRLAEMLGGQIDVTSKPGEGSTFILRIDPGPLAEITQAASLADDALQEQSRPPASISHLRGRILLVDDNPDNRLLLSIYLKEAGADVTLAENGRIACDKALDALASGAPFDVILMDMQMPELDGYGATADLRSRGYRGTIIALTAHAMADDRSKCLHAGCNDYLGKPVRREQLLSTVGRHMSSSGNLEVSKITPALLSTEHKAAQRQTNLLRPPIYSDLIDEGLLPLLNIYISRLSQYAEEIEAVLQAGDIETLSLKVHDLRGTGGLYGLMPVTDAASAVEAALQHHASIEAVTKTVNALLEVIHRVAGAEKYEQLPALSNNNSVAGSPQP